MYERKARTHTIKWIHTSFAMLSSGTVSREISHELLDFA